MTLVEKPKRNAPAKQQAENAPNADDSLKSLSKVMRILEVFSTIDRKLSVAEVCRRTGFPRSTTHRLLASMKEVGLLDQNRQRDRYRLGLKLFELGNVVLANLDLHREAAPYVKRLGQLTGQSVHLAIFDGRRAIVIHRADPVESAMLLSLTESAPVHCTSVGKAILAFQPDEVIARIIEAGLQKYTANTITSGERLREDLAVTRKRGYAIDEGEHQAGLRCCGAPIRDHEGRVFAAISVSGASWKLPTGEIASVAEIVLQIADTISASL
jgi:DNA-binding IclR family transcriptional regulator